MSLGDFAPSWIASEGLDHNLSLGPHAKLLGMDTALMDLEDASHSWALDFLAFPKIRWKISSNQLKSTHVSHFSTDLPCISHPDSRCSASWTKRKRSSLGSKGRIWTGGVVKKSDLNGFTWSIHLSLVEKPVTNGDQ